VLADASAYEVVSFEDEAQAPRLRASRSGAVKTPAGHDDRPPADPAALLAAIVSFGLHIGTNDRRYLRFGVTIVKWTVIAGLGFFAVLILERMTG
jgi:hypothetical protein